MQGNPERPYAQLLTPAAKSQKLLLRLQHKKLLSAADVERTQVIFAIWQKLLQKNIPSTPWPEFADLMIFPAEEYIALLLHPFGQLTAVQEAVGWRHLDGYLLLDQRPDAELLVVRDDHLLISTQLMDRIGARAWQAASRGIVPWQASLVKALAVTDQDAALDLLGLLRQYAAAPWAGLELPEQLLVPVQRVYFALWRARGRAVSGERLGTTSVHAMAALDWLVRVSVAESVNEHFRLR